MHQTRPKLDRCMSHTEKYYRENKWLFSLLFLSVFLLLFGLGNRVFWVDEASMYAYGKSILVYGYPYAFDGKNYNNNANTDGLAVAWPWIPYYLGAATLLLLPDSEFFFRLPFALLGVGCVILFFYLCRRWVTDKRVAIIAPFLLVTSFPFLLMMRSAGYYSLAIVLVLLVVYLFRNLLDEKAENNKKGWLMFTSLLILLYYTHTLIFLGLVSALTVVFAIHCSKVLGVIRKRMIYCLFASYLLVAIVGLPWFFYAGLSQKSFSLLHFLGHTQFFSVTLALFVIPLPLLAISGILADDQFRKKCRWYHYIIGLVFLESLLVMSLPATKIMGSIILLVALLLSIFFYGWRYWLVPSSLDFFMLVILVYFLFILIFTSPVGVTFFRYLLPMFPFIFIIIGEIISRLTRKNAIVIGCCFLLATTNILPFLVFLPLNLVFPSLMSQEFTVYHKNTTQFTTFQSPLINHVRGISVDIREKQLEYSLASAINKFRKSPYDFVAVQTSGDYFDTMLLPYADAVISPSLRDYFGSSGEATPLNLTPSLVLVQIPKHQYEQMQAPGKKVRVGIAPLVASQVGEIIIDPAAYTFVGVIPGFYLFAGTLPEPYTYISHYSEDLLTHYGIFRRESASS